MAADKMLIVPSGFAGLDTLLGGGLPVGSLLVVVGPPGTGKTLFLQQLCFSWVHRTLTAPAEPSDNAPLSISRDFQVVSATAGTTSTQNTPTALYFSLLSEPHFKLVQHISQFEFFDESLLANQIKLLSLTQPMQEGLDKVISTIVNTARHERAGLVTIDGLGALADSPHLAEQNLTIRQFLYRLSSQLNILGITTVVALERILEKSASEGELTVADGILSFSRPLLGSRRLRRAEVIKLRGMNISEGLHSYEINPTGLHFYPRAEALAKRRLEEREERVSDQPLASSESAELGRVQLGLAELDSLLGGGLPTGSATVIAGSAGVGKTLITLHYLLAAAARGEAGLYIGFHENAGQLVSKAARFGLNLASMIEKGLVNLLILSPIELEPDKAFDAICQKLIDAPIPVQHVVVDGLQELELACMAHGRGREFIAGLLANFKSQSITSLYTYEISKLIGTELDLSQTNFVPLTENLLLLKQVEYRTKLYMIIVVLKMRDSAYDRTLRQYEIKDGVGLEVLEAFQSAEGLLSGLARQLAQ